MSRSADPPRNFSLPLDERIRALTGGVPAWSARKRTIEDRQTQLVASLVAFHDDLVAKGTPAGEALARMRERAATLDLAKLRALVAAHNRWFPIEANLPVDPATHEYVVYGRRWTPEPEPSTEDFAARAASTVASDR